MKKTLLIFFIVLIGLWCVACGDVKAPDGGTVPDSTNNEISSTDTEASGSSVEQGSDNTATAGQETAITDAKRAEIIEWITAKYEYYDKIEKRYTGDQFTKTIFDEATSIYGYNYDQLIKIWNELPLE